MADWNLPTLTSSYSDFLDYLKARDEDSAKMFDGVGSNLGIGTIRWSSGNKRFEKYDGSSWSALVPKYMIDVDNSDNLEGHPSSYFAKLQGSSTQTFSVANAVNSNEAVNRGQLYDNFASYGNGNALSSYTNDRTINASDYNDITLTGFYSASGTANNHPPGLNNSATLLVIGRASTYTTQIAQDDISNTLWYRHQKSGTWTGWYKLWHSGNDGTGSDLDAGLLEGHRSTDFRTRSNVTSGDIDNVIVGGDYTYTTTLTNLPNGAADTGSLQVIAGQPHTSATTQTLIDCNSKMFVRYGGGNSIVWQSWEEIGNTQRQLGTTLTDVTANRALDTTYTNSSDYVLTVCIGVSGYGTATLVIDGKNTAVTPNIDGTNPTQDALVGFVPPGRSYEVSVSVNIDLYYWTEM